jgi:hypothetical protein
LADVEFLKKLREVRHVNRGQCDACESAVRVVEAPGDGDNPLAARTAFHRPSDQRAVVVRLSVMTKIVAVAVVQAFQAHGFRSCQPISGLIVNEQTADTPKAGPAKIDKGLEPRDGFGSGTVDLQSMDQAGQDIVGQFQRVVRMLRQRLREVRHVHFGIF